MDKRKGAWAGYTGPTMRLLLCACLLACLAPLSPLTAQTYTPRQIRFEGGGDPAELLHLTGLAPGEPLTKEQIEAALGKLADTGAFTDLSYTVSADALVIKLGSTADTAGQALPIRFTNLVWWSPDELTRLLEARVPLFHGELPLTGSLTDHVCAALVQLLADKGIRNAKVEAMPTTLADDPAAAPAGKQPRPHTGVNAIALSVTEPEILLGNVALSGAAPSTQVQLDVVTGMLGMKDFQTDVTAKAIRDNVADTEKNAGFLQAVVDPPVFSAPRPDLNSYAIDASATVHPGEMYHIASIELAARPPLTAAEAAEAIGLKVAQPAGAMTLKVSPNALQRAYYNTGHLEAQVSMTDTFDHAAHTVAVRFKVEPGELYRLASVDTSALSPELRAAFTSQFAGKPGMEAGLPLGIEVTRALAAIGATHSVKTGMLRNRASHTVTVLLSPMHPVAAVPAPGR